MTVRAAPPGVRLRRQEDMGLLSRAAQVQHEAAPPPDPDPKPAPPSADSSADPRPVPATDPARAADVEPDPEPPEPAHRVRCEAPSVARRRPPGRTASAPAAAAPTSRQPSGKASAHPPRGTPDLPPRSRTGQRAPAQPPTAGPARDPIRAPTHVCPVVGRPVCYYGDCHHWCGDRCGHPDAAGNPQARRPRARRAASGTAVAAGV